MEWLGIVAGWAALCGVIIGIAPFISKGMTDDAKSELAAFLSQSTATDWARKANQWFLSAFDLVYQVVDRDNHKILFVANFFMWWGLIATLVLMLLAPVLFTLFGVPLADASIILLISLVSSIGAALLVFIILIFLLKIPPIKKLNVLTKAILASSIAAVPVSVTVIIFAIPGTGIGSNLIGSIATYIVVNLAFLSGVGFVVAIVKFMDGGRGIYAIVTPQRAILSSALFLVLIALIQGDAKHAFFSDVSAQGYLLLGFLAVNIFADMISLMETRWVLQRTLNAGFFGLIGWLVFDLLASAGIFLALPLALGEFRAFLDGILFQGERPWLGILFWTTFATSGLFYCFLLAALLVRPLAWVIQLTRPRFDARNEPVAVLTFSLVIVITLLFGAGIAGRGLYMLAQ